MLPSGWHFVLCLTCHCALPYRVALCYRHSQLALPYRVALCNRHTQLALPYRVARSMPSRLLRWTIRLHCLRWDTFSSNGSFLARGSLWGCLRIYFASKGVPFSCRRIPVGIAPKSLKSPIVRLEFYTTLSPSMFCCEDLRPPPGRKYRYRDESLGSSKPMCATNASKPREGQTKC